MEFLMKGCACKKSNCITNRYTYRKQNRTYGGLVGESDLSASQFLLEGRGASPKLRKCSLVLFKETMISVDDNFALVDFYMGI